jgi:hypothetical protein
MLVETCSLNEENIKSLDSIVKDLKEQAIENKANYERCIFEANETNSKLICEKNVNEHLTIYQN